MYFPNEIVVQVLLFTVLSKNSYSTYSYSTRKDSHKRIADITLL